MNQAPQIGRGEGVHAAEIVAHRLSERFPHRKILRPQRTVHAEQQQIRSLHVTTAAGAVPIWDQPDDGTTTDVATVIATMQALREHARCQDVVLLGG